jgi:hypothetical protein
VRDVLGSLRVHGATTELTLVGDRGFESGFLHRRVCEPFGPLETNGQPRGISRDAGRRSRRKQECS